MFDKFRKAIVPHIMGFLLIILGWLISIVNVGLNVNRFTTQGVFNIWTFIGLIMILIGAYLPEAWIGIRNAFSKKKENIDLNKKNQ